VALPCLCQKRPDLELRSPLLASPQLALRLAPIVEHPDGPVILRSETLFQRSRPPALDHHPDQPRDDQYPDRDQDPDPCVHDGSPSSGTVRSGSPGSYPFAARDQTCRRAPAPGTTRCCVSMTSCPPARRDPDPLSATPTARRPE